ncbi:hypothetical protein B1L04_02720 [Microcystis aeruginosa KW]|uniref:Uncharacterized protein n=1 Tax=Microcystis aeruginosa KW TaxID=1960155 RepID=A0A1V4BZR0_MICAE|nr:hypothetical protein B1L04_02720 [Microcystis aeruginosa KW]
MRCSLMIKLEVLRLIGFQLFLLINILHNSYQVSKRATPLLPNHYQSAIPSVAMFLMVFCPETSYNGRKVKFENFCLKPSLRKDFRSL